MPPFPRLKPPDEFERELPEAPCLRCGATALAGYVTAGAGRGRANLGWIDGAPSLTRWRDRLLDSRYINKPARWPAHRCTNCGLVWFDLSESST